MTSLNRFLILALALSPAALFAQGALVPAGAPAPTMKTLTQIEPRVPVQSLPADADGAYVISENGSYYLTGNLTGVAGKHGIKIAATQVSLDLNGFTLTGVAGSLDGIRVTVSNCYLHVSHGGIQKWDGAGINHPGIGRSMVSDLSIKETKGPGITLPNSSIAERVTTQSTVRAGIQLGSHSSARGCTVSQVTAGDNPVINDSVWGIIASTVSDCTVNYVQGAAVYIIATGIEAETVHNCSVDTVTANGTQMCIGVTAHVVRGCQITTITGATVRSCGIQTAAAYENFVINVSGADATAITSSNVTAQIVRNRIYGAGIRLTSNSHVMENLITLTYGSGVGIYVSGSSNRIEANHIVSGATGIQVVSSNNVVVRNTVAASTTKYSIAAGNQAPVAVVTADDITTASPWANFSQ